MRLFTTVVNLMRAGWSLKDAAVVLGIHPNRVTQSLDPTLRRVALLWRADPTRTLLAILAAVAELDVASTEEIDLQERIRQGLADRSELGQRCPSSRGVPRSASAPAPQRCPSFQSSAR